MKKILVTIAAALVLSGLVSCEKALDFQNENGLSTGMFWKTQDDLNAGLNAVYNMFYRQGTWTRNIHVQLNGMADDGVSYAGWTEVAEWTKFKYTDYSFWEVPKKIWAEHYTAINRANQVLDHIDDPNVIFDSEDARAQIKAEALWLRSFFYFYLTILWDTEPLCLHTSSAGDQPGNSTEEATFGQLEKDLITAIDILPAKRAKEQGRPTKGAAYALLAKVYAQQHKWEDAARCLDWIVEGEGKGIYDLVPNWHDNFDPKTEDNKESIYEIHFSLCNMVGFDQTNNYLDPNAQLATQLECLQSPKGEGWNNIECNRWVMEYFKRKSHTLIENGPYGCKQIPASRIKLSCIHRSIDLLVLGTAEAKLPLVKITLYVNAELPRNRGLEHTQMVLERAVKILQTAQCQLVPVHRKVERENLHLVITYYAAYGHFVNSTGLLVLKQ